MEAAQAIQLLADVGVFDGDTEKLQWSVLYNLITGNGEIFANRKTNNIIEFHLNTDKQSFVDFETNFQFIPYLVTDTFPESVIVGHTA